MNIRCTYRCSECGKTYDITPDIMLCPACSKKQRDKEPLRGILEVKYRAEAGIKIEDLMPVEKKYFPDIPVGNTPLWQPKELGAHANLYLKDDTGNLTGSFKDRASLLVAAFAKKYGIDRIVLASTGNAASSMAGVAAAAGLKTTIFLPKTAPRAKMIQVLQYGATVISVDGNYDKAFDLSLEYSKKYGFLSRNTAYNPLTIEGKKTVSAEICKELKGPPDHVFVPVGDGVILSGVYKGFRDLLEFGFINKIPEIIAVQAEGSAAVHNAFKNGKFSFETGKTIADSIAVDIPRCGYYALKQLKKYHGRTVLVSDEEILSAQKRLSERTGLFAEPAAAASYAAYDKMKNSLPANAGIVLMITGNGLKDADAATGKIKFPERHIKNIGEIL
ncbi:MAG: threonine synthase [Candidatus Marinimicrobia bacterium]|nr:threonine synthase [Candidatus Neomarinimicrobiota bacterium]